MSTAASTFTDDAYNKHLSGEWGGRPGTLIGNWLEESVVRSATGIGRSVPQRHIPKRAKVLQKDPSATSKIKRESDDTFSRIMGFRQFGYTAETGFEGRTSDEWGRHAGEADFTPASSRVGLREKADLEEFSFNAEATQAQRDAELARLAGCRHFDTTYKALFPETLPTSTQASSPGPEKEAAAADVPTKRIDN